MSNEGLKKGIDIYMEEKYPGKVEEKLLTVTTSTVWECGGNRWKEGRKGDFYFSLYTLLCHCCIFKSSPHISFLKLKIYIV